MRGLRSIWRAVEFAFLGLAAWVAGEAIVFGKDAEESSTTGAGAWVWAYMLVILIISLGLIVVCKSSGRRDRAKPEVYAEAKTPPKE